MKVSVVGGRGYMGGELLRLLMTHPDVEIMDVTSSSVAGELLKSHFPHLSGLGDICFSEYDPQTIRGETVFLALPHTLSMKIASELRKLGKKVIDLSGDFRIRDHIVYENWYGTPHANPELLKTAVYGLPELHKKEIGEASLVASPGCYPTSIILGVAPLLKANIGVLDIIANSVSGVSGAGRSLSPAFHFPEMNEEMFAYKALSHRHTPEILQELSLLHNGYMPLTFTPHVGSFTRGIYSSIYVSGDIKANISDIRSIYEEFYADSPFVTILGNDEHPKLSSVVGTNNCKISFFQDETGRVIIFSIIDNLIKGGAGQAVQSLNIMMGIDETTALVSPPPFP